MHNLKFFLFSLVVVFAGFLSTATAALALDINGMRFGSHGSAVRAVLEMNEEADFRATVQSDPPRVVVDLPQVGSQPAIKRSDLPFLVKDIRVEPLGNNHTRLTFLLDTFAVIRSAFLMPASSNIPARLVIDIAPVAGSIFPKYVGRPYGTLVVREDAQSIPFAGVNGPKLAPIVKPKEPEKPQLSDLPMIVIDAGHGGIDSGAVGGGIQEKDVTLSVARALKKQLEATGRYRARLTRDRDIFIQLNERSRIARRNDADLFISIHADSIAGNGYAAHGASFYTLSDRASDEQTARLAARENQADLLAGIVLPTEDKEVANILIDLAMRETMNQSNRFANNLVNAFLKKEIPTLPDAHRHAGFVVLKAPDVPSVLVEVGFLSNPEEARKLADGTYRAQVANAIAVAVDSWFKTREP